MVYILNDSYSDAKVTQCSDTAMFARCPSYLVRGSLLHKDIDLVSMAISEAPE